MKSLYNYIKESLNNNIVDQAISILTGGEDDLINDYEEMFNAFKKWCSDAKNIEVIQCGGEYDSTELVKATNISPEDVKKYNEFTSKVSKKIGNKLRNDGHVGDVQWGENKDWFYVLNYEVESLWHKIR